jgi:hypothetical protein
LVTESPPSSRESWKRRWTTVAGRRCEIDFLYHRVTMLLEIDPVSWRLKACLVEWFVFTVELYDKAGVLDVSARRHGPRAALNSAFLFPFLGMWELVSGSAVDPDIYVRKSTPAFKACQKWVIQSPMCNE